MAQDSSTSVTTAPVQFAHYTDVNALARSTLIFMGNPMYKDAQKITNVFHTASTV